MPKLTADQVKAALKVQKGELATANAALKTAHKSHQAGAKERAKAVAALTKDHDKAHAASQKSLAAAQKAVEKQTAAVAKLEAQLPKKEPVAV